MQALSPRGPSVGWRIVIALQATVCEGRGCNASVLEGHHLCTGCRSKLAPRQPSPSARRSATTCQGCSAPVPNGWGLCGECRCRACYVLVRRGDGLCVDCRSRLRARRFRRTDSRAQNPAKQTSCSGWDSRCRPCGALIPSEYYLCATCRDRLPVELRRRGQKCESWMTDHPEDHAIGICRDALRRQCRDFLRGDS